MTEKDLRLMASDACDHVREQIASEADDDEAAQHLVETFLDEPIVWVLMTLAARRALRMATGIQEPGNE